MQLVKDCIRTIPDFPKLGIQFKDISPLLSDNAAFSAAINALKERHENNRIDQVVGIEARGFIFASALAYALNTGLCLIRKAGKLPYSVHSQCYDLEYGTDILEIHADAFLPKQRILLIDDVLATGGTVAAALDLIESNFDVDIVESNFVIELSALNGRSKFANSKVFSLIKY